MITLAILLTCLIAIGAVILFFGTGFILIFGDLIVAVLIILGFGKLIGAIRKRNRKEEE